MAWPADPSHAVRVLCIGECMLELRHTAPLELRVGFAGDTYNTAAYLRRSLDDNNLRTVEVGYLTGLGADPYSQQLRNAWAEERITDHSLTLSGRLPGVYAVDTDQDGERTFSYWRTASAAAHMFKQRDWISHVAGDLIHFSGITLQLMSNSTRQLFLSRLAQLRTAGAIISFDTNYRPAGWATIDGARDAFDRAATTADVILVTQDDESGLRRDDDPDTILDRYSDQGAAEVVLKLGPDGAIVQDKAGRHRIPAAAAAHVIDTTAAGDSFAGAYLATRLSGRTPTQAAEAGADLASHVIQHPGAIVPRHSETAPR